MNSHRQLAFYTLTTLLVLVLLALYSIAFGASLTPRPEDYTPVDYLAASCSGLGTDTTVFRFGSNGDVRWIEIYVQADSRAKPILVAVASFEPGPEGPLVFAEVLLPSGQVLHFDGRAALQNSPYAEVCQVANLWLQQT